MTVAELIAQLRDLDQDLVVAVEDDRDLMDAHEVKLARHRREYNHVHDYSGWAYESEIDTQPQLFSDHTEKRVVIR
jgi:UDP-N-acetylglucosamine transferase subunit ALG13